MDECDHRFVDGYCRKCGGKLPRDGIERFKKSKELAPLECPWCKVECKVRETTDGDPLVGHPLPACDAFNKYKVEEFIRIARQKSAN